MKGDVMATTTSPQGKTVNYDLKPLPANNRDKCDFDPCKAHAVWEIQFHDSAPASVVNPKVCAEHGKPKTWQW